MYLLTDGTEKSPLLGFCLNVISKHGDKWPPSEEVLAKQFVSWFGFDSLLTKEKMKRSCEAKRVTLTFDDLPLEIRGLNFSFHHTKEIVITAEELAPFSHSHTLLHEFRELLEHEFVALGRATVGSPRALEVQAEIFAVYGRMEAGLREMPAFFEMAQNVENKWARRLSYALVIVGGLVYIFSCVYLPHMEDAVAEARR